MKKVPGSSFAKMDRIGRVDWPEFSRRAWVMGALAGAGLFACKTMAAQDLGKKPRVAVVLTSFTYRSHSHVIMENFLTPYLFCGKVTEPGCEVVSLYADQSPEGDMAPAVCEQFKIPKFATVAEALCVGGKELAVDAVLLIGEHGDYPKTKHGIVMYPRKQLFDQCIEVMRKSGKVVPLFNDKHFSYRYDWSREMYDTAKGMNIPLMAGSSVPLAERRPSLEMPAGSKIREAISIHSGPLESYDFHGLEVLQSMVESRQGGETGVASVQYLGKEEVMESARRGEWSLELAKLALKARDGEGAELSPNHGILLQYKDGMKGLVLSVNGKASTWGFAARVEGRDEPIAASFYVGPWNNRNLFKALSHAIQHFFRTQKSPYPVERTLLTSGVLDAMMRSVDEKGKAISTPELSISYQPQDFQAFRENGETWKRITDAIEQPKGIVPVLP
ncbi:MAG: hypothetical protein ACO1RA_14740 [Planctomycetaceae bacterium]